MNAAWPRGEGQPRAYLLVMAAVLLMAAAKRIIALRDAPPGPAMPVMLTPTSVPNTLRAPRAISNAVSALTAPCS